MKRFSGTSLRWVLAVIIANCWIGTKALADSIETQPVLVFRIVNSVQIPEEVLMRAQKHVEYIYQESGVRIEWLSNGVVPQVLDGRKRLQLTINLVSQSLARTMGQSERTTGFALGHDGHDGRAAYIFAERVEDQAKTVSERRNLSKEVAHSLVLGQVIAHEAGHLM